MYLLFFLQAQNFTNISQISEAYDLKILQALNALQECLNENLSLETVGDRFKAVFIEEPNTTVSKKDLIESFIINFIENDIYTKFLNPKNPESVFLVDEQDSSKFFLFTTPYLKLFEEKLGKDLIYQLLQNVFVSLFTHFSQNTSELSLGTIDFSFFKNNFPLFFFQELLKQLPSQKNKPFHVLASNYKKKISQKYYNECEARLIAIKAWLSRNGISLKE